MGHVQCLIIQFKIRCTLNVTWPPLPPSPPSGPPRGFLQSLLREIQPSPPLPPLTLILRKSIIGLT